MTKVSLIALATLIAHLGLLILLPGDGLWAEALYAERIYPLLGPIVAFVPSKLPFSMSGLLIAGLIIWIPASLALNLARWRRGRATAAQAAGALISAYLVVLACVFHSFFVFWGYNYLRPPLEKRLGFFYSELAVEQQTAASIRIIEEAVAARVEIDRWDRAELDRLIDRAIDVALTELEGRSTPVVSPLKGDFGTRLLARFGSRGVVSPWTLEAHADFGMPASLLPFTAAHEKAHLAGYAREREASFVAWYALTRSDDRRLRYAGYLGIVPYFLNSTTRGLAAPLLTDLAAAASYQSEHVSETLMRTGRRAYSTYLRANRVESGLGDYRQVSQLITAWLVFSRGTRE